MKPLRVLVFVFYAGMAIGIGNLYSVHEATSQPKNAEMATSLCFSDSLWLEIKNQVSTDSIVSYITRLQNFKTRWVSSDSNEKAGDYLYNCFYNWGLETVYDNISDAKINDISFDETGQCGWICGDAGTVGRTTDGGKSWQIFSLAIAANLRGLYAFDKDEVWIVGERIIIHSLDGGKTWQENTNFASLGPLGGSWNKVYFFNRSLGWIISRFGKDIYKTDNGGKTWEVYSTNLSSIQMRSDISFVDSLTGWVASGNGIFKSSDSGRSWQYIKICDDTPKTYFNKIYFLNPALGWIVGTSGKVYATADSGNHWLFQETSIKEDLLSVFFLNRYDGWAVGNSGTLLYTQNGGKKWQISSLIDSNDFMGIAFSNSQCGWIVGQGEQILYTEDSGQSWSTKRLDTKIKSVGNIIARIRGKVNPDNKYIISAHYDSYAYGPSDDWSLNPAPGANDNASGVAAVLECARILRQYRLSNTIEFVCFNGMEDGLKGSNHYVTEHFNRKATIQGNISVETIGNPFTNPVSLINILYLQNSSNIADIFTEVAPAVTDLRSNLALLNQFNPSSDHFSFAKFGYPSVLVYGENSFLGAQHSPEDFLQILDPIYMKKIIQITTVAMTQLGVIAKTSVQVKPQGTPQADNYFLFSNYPNPFNQSTQIKYVIPEDTYINIMMYHINGQLVKRLANTWQKPGIYELKWDGMDEFGKNAPSGVYIISMETLHFNKVIKCLLLK